MLRLSTAPTNRRLTLLLITLLLVTVAGPVWARPRVAVVMSGGGAKGVAHVGALRVIEAAGIPIDIVVGTSMGAIVGGLYATGYTAAQLDTMIRQQQWDFLLSDRVARTELTIEERALTDRYLVKLELQKKLSKTRINGLIRGENLRNLFHSLTIGYNDSTDFAALPRPFACVAMNIIDGEEYVFHHGVLSQAMRASMAIPGVFAPVRIGDKLLVDGGMKNNYPVDVAKAMGADIVIGITVQNEKLRTMDELYTPGSLLHQLIDLSTRNKYDENIAHTDVLIRVPTGDFSASSFTSAAIDSLMHLGYIAAQQQWWELQALRQRLDTDSSTTDTDIPHIGRSITPPPLCIDTISYEGIRAQDIHLLDRITAPLLTQPITIPQILSVVHLIRSLDMYSNVYYTLTPRPALRGRQSGYLLTYHAAKRYDKTLRAGIRFDTEDIASVMLYGSFRFNTHIPTKLEASVRLAKRYEVSLQWTTEPVLRRRLGVGYTFFHNELSAYKYGQRQFNVLYFDQHLDFTFSDYWFRNLMYQVGMRLRHYSFSDILSQGGNTFDQRHALYVIYQLRLHYNSLDRSAFATNGSLVNLALNLYTEDFLRMRDHTPPLALQATWQQAIRLAPHWVWQPALHVRALWGRDIPPILKNYFGGISQGYYIDQQLPFAGVSNAVQADNKLVIASSKVRYELAPKHYLALQSDAAVSDDELLTLLQRRLHLGFSLSYAYDSPIGPISAYLGYYNQSRRVDFFLSLGTFF